MNILKFLESVASENLFEPGTTSRRDSLAKFGQFGKKLAVASVPFGLATFSNKAFARTAAEPTNPTEVLNLALTLEYLEAAFYSIGYNTTGLIPDADRQIFDQIRGHESDHVVFLQGALGSAAVASPNFDFTAGGAFNTFGDYDTFKALAQAFEDTGVRAYKGQAKNLISAPDLLTYALQIHSVEARHASQVRRLRGQKGWIIGNDRGGLPVQAQATYDGEQNTDQAGFNTSAVPGTFSPALTAQAGSESFDEPITGDQAVAIASLFIVP